MKISLKSFTVMTVAILVASMFFATTPVRAQVPLDFEKSGPDIAYRGEVITYTIEVTNLADVDMVDVILEDEMLGFIYACMDLSSGETLSFALDYTIPGDAVGSLTNLVSFSAEIDGTPIYAERSWIVEILPIPVAVDIKPGSWPNPLELRERGVFPVAVCGTEDFDVTTIDPETLRLTWVDGVGVAPLRWSYDDAATPYTGEPCNGHNLTGDGYVDLALKFHTQEVIQTLGLDALGDRDVIILTLTGNLKAEHGGTPIRGEDCILILVRI